MPNKNLKDAVYTQRYVYNFHFHLIWTTKYKNQIFNANKLVSEMKDILQKTAIHNKISIENIEVVPDYVHILISFPPSKTPTSAIKALKGRSAQIFLAHHPEIRKDKCWRGHLWSPSYYMSTLGDMSKNTVEKYINNQRYNKKNKSPNRHSSHD